MTFRISFSNLWVYTSGAADRKLAVSALPADGIAHIHGNLTIEVAGRPLLGLGYFGPGDVCMNEWAHELVTAADKLASIDPSDYVYDEGEQGQPAFKFARVGHSVFVSVIASELSEADGDPDWQQVPCLLSEFLSSVQIFQETFEETIKSAAPVGGPKWIDWAMKRKAQQPALADGVPPPAKP